MVVLVLGYAMGFIYIWFIEPLFLLHLHFLFRAKLFVISHYFLLNILVSANISGGTISFEVLSVDPL